MDPVQKTEDENSFSKQVSEKEHRKLRVRGQENKGIAFGLGMFGMVGWSVAVPLLLGILLGQWLDKHYSESFSWTITCLVLGLITGCTMGWYWVKKEDNEMHIDKNEKDE